MRSVTGGTDTKGIVPTSGGSVDFGEDGGRLSDDTLSRIAGSLLGAAVSHSLTGHGRFRDPLSYAISII
jgi:hypothetical protein